jgi:hypothetical protein
MTREKGFIPEFKRYVSMSKKIKTYFDNMVVFPFG